MFMHLYECGSISCADIILKGGARVDSLPAAEAVEHLVHKYGKLVFHFIYGLTADWEESQDLTQDTFVQALRAIDAARKSSGDHFQAKPWLMRIALNTVRMHHRRCKRFRFVPFSQLETEHAGLEIISEAAAPVQPTGYGTREGGDPATLVAERDAVQRSLARLPDIWRVPLLLSVVGGFSSAEIARLLHLKEVAVRQRLARARKQFRYLYAGQSGDMLAKMISASPSRRRSSGLVASKPSTRPPQTLVASEA
jgi:RNA polymerase sigma-70 factor (ECF subfamily)